MQVLEAIKESQSSTITLETDALGINMPSANYLPDFETSFMKSEIYSSPPKKSWFPTQECQFKCCPRCRPTFYERSYLSLDAVANGELPAIAITGLGFQCQNERPVALVKHVRNLGLRPDRIRTKTSYKTGSMRSTNYHLE